jgi:hypothetical protein
MNHNSHDLQFQVQNPDGTFSPTGHDAPLSSMPTARPNMVDYVANQLSQSSHPIVIIFHILFKAAAVLLYLFANWFIGKSEGAFITWSVVCILLLAADFWVVKNVTGRLLVGLRWWNKVENDTTTWVFESAEQYQQQGGRPRYQVNPFDKNVFWTVLYATPLAWGAFFVMALISFHWEWLLVDGLALALAGANVYGYYKCSTDQKARFERMMQQGAQQGAMAMMRHQMLSMLTGVQSGGGSSSSATYV